MLNHPTSKRFLPTSLLAVLLVACGSPEEATGEAADEVLETQQADFTVTTVADGLTQPWGMAFLPNGRILVTEKPGQLRIYDPAQGLLPPVSGVPEVAVQGQGGLLDVALHPDFANNQWVYLSYSAENNGTYGTEVARGKLRGNALEDVEVLFKAEPKVEGGVHFGSRLVFDREGHLSITLGDRGQGEPAQDVNNHIGTVIRLHEDGSVPQDNPFVGKDSARPEIFSYGHRNLQGATLHPQTGELWTHEHGPQGGDEINIPQAGTNYGWPTITYGVNYGSGTKIGEGTHKEGMAQPLYKWVPSIAPSGMVFYTGDKFPQWQGDLLVGSLKFQMLVRLEMQDGEVVDEERMLNEELGRIRAVDQGPDGYVYLLTDKTDGGLYRLEPVAENQD